MLPPVKESVGAQILKKMGWRPGQGIGPRVTWRQRKLQDKMALTTSHTSEDDIPEDDEEANKHTYAPRDTPMVKYAKKDNSYGLGFIPGGTLNERLGVKSPENTSGPKLAGMLV